MHKVSPERFRHLSQRIQIASKLQDWNALIRYDEQLKALLVAHKNYMDDPRLAPEIARLKAVHKVALEALTLATQELKGSMHQFSTQQERAKAYQFVTIDEVLK